MHLAHFVASLCFQNFLERFALTPRGLQRNVQRT